MSSKTTQNAVWLFTAFRSQETLFKLFTIVHYQSSILHNPSLPYLFNWEWLCTFA